MNKKSLIFNGFTLVELLIVLTVIGIIIAFAVTGLTGSQVQARDAQRKTELNQYRAAFEQMANKNNNFYRNYTSGTDLTTVCVDLGLGSNCPDDPISARNYAVITNGTGNNYNATAYVLYANLEDENSTLYWLVCSNGRSGQTTSTPTLALCNSL